jgi:hypothetical protein
MIISVLTFRFEFILLLLKQGDGIRGARGSENSAPGSSKVEFWFQLLAARISHKG